MSASRRAVLRAAVAWSAAGWVGTAFAASPSERQVELFAAWHAARRQGVPLLAIVIPADPAVASARGRVVGGALQESPDRLFAALSGYAPVCGTAEDLHLLGVVVAPDAWFAVIGTAAVPATARSIAGPPLRDGDPIDAVIRLLLADLDVAEPGEPTRAESGRGTWLLSRLPGSHWANSTGCGYSIEEVDDNLIMGCGMGSIPERAARFLFFLDPNGVW